jgi:hypothetical protein
MRLFCFENRYLDKTRESTGLAYQRCGGPWCGNPIDASHLTQSLIEKSVRLFCFENEFSTDHLSRSAAPPEPVVRDPGVILDLGGPDKPGKVPGWRTCGAAVRGTAFR